MAQNVIDTAWFHRRNWKAKVGGLQIQGEITDEDGRLYRLSDADIEDEHGNEDIPGAIRGTTIDGRRIILHKLLYVEVTDEHPVIGDLGHTEKVVFDK